MMSRYSVRVRKRRNAARRRSLHALGAACVMLVFAGCSTQPQRSPVDPGIPEARAAAADHLDAVTARVVFSDRAVVFGSGREDSCGFGTQGTFSSPPRNYRCWMQWVQLVVIPDAVTREEIAAALDAELAAMDLPITESVVRDLVRTHPNNSSRLPIGARGHEGDVVISIESQPFRALSWPDPSVLVGGNVSESGDIGEVTAADIEATRAAQFVVVSASVEYWAEAGVRVLPADGSAPPAFAVEQSAHGDNYYFDLAQAEPGEAAESCLADPSVAPTSITRQQEPFPRATFKLFGVATAEDAARVRDCLQARLTSGTLAWYQPYYRGGETPSPVPTPLPGPDHPL